MMSQGHSVLVLAVDPWVRLVGLDVEKMAQQVENNKSLEGAGGTFYVPPVIYLGTKMKLYYRRPYVRVKHKQINMNIIYSKYSNRIAILSNDELDFFDALVSNDELDEFKYEEYLSFHVELIDSTIDKLIRNYIVFLTEEEFLENDFSKKTQDVKGIDTVYIHPTMRCNLNCSYCYNKAVVGLLKEMSVSSWSNAIDKLVSTGLKNVVITGGEPTLYRELEELVDCLKQRNLHVTIITNGTHMDRVIPLLNQIDCLIVSLDSYISTTNGRIRIGADAYDVYSNILNIKEHKDKIIINAVVTKNNYEQLDEFQKKVELIGMRLRRMRYTATCINDADEMVYDIIYPDDVTYLFSRQRYKCHAGTNVFAIASNGDVYPCQTLLKKELCITNVNDSNWLTHITNKEIELNSIGNSYEKIQKCTTCEFEYICCGGCPSTRYNLTGSFYDLYEPECEYLKKCSIRNLENVRIKCCGEGEI